MRPTLAPRRGLHLPVGVVLTVAVAQANAQAEAGSTPPPAGAVALLQHLDDAFGRGDLDGYGAAFTPDQPLLHAAMLQHLRDVVARTASRTRHTTVAAWRTLGPHTVLQVRRTTTLHNRPGSEPSATTCRDDGVLVLRQHGDTWRVVLAVDSAPGADAGEAPFRCPPCNYSIGGVPGFLCVPLPPGRSGALEAASFFLLGSDVVADVAVQVDAAGRSATVAAQELADTLQRLERATPGVVAPWRPASLAALPAGTSAAHVVQDLPDGRTVHSHVVACGGLQHLVLVRGSATALQQHAATVAALLASFRLLDPTRAAATACGAPLEHHTGGVLTGSRYENRRFGVALDGAEDWRPVMLTGGSAFRVVWTSPQGSRLWLTGYTVPTGLERWCATTADRWLDQQCSRAGIRLLPQDAACTPWQDERDCDGAERTLVGEDRGRGEVPVRRWFRLHRRNDLLLVVDGFATTAGDEAALARMLATLRRR